VAVQFEAIEVAIVIVTDANTYRARHARARVVYILEGRLTPGVLARGNDHATAFAIENHERHRRVVLADVVEDAEPAAMRRLNLERVDVPHLGLQDVVEA